MKTPIELACHNAYKSGYEAAQPKWIKCSDRLPQCTSQHGKNYASGYVLAMTRYREHEIVQLWNNKQWESQNGESGYEISYITHWMPLPELPSPPKTTEDDNP